MPDRRKNVDGEVNVEYAIFMAERRGLREGIHYLDSCGLPREVLHRILHHPELRRMRERRAVARH